MPEAENFWQKKQASFRLHADSLSMGEGCLHGAGLFVEERRVLKTLCLPVPISCAGRYNNIMPIPPFLPDTWLPEGHHNAAWEEIEAMFGGEPGSSRRETWSRLLAWRDAARAKGLAGRVVLNGSFVSAKENPGDFDLLFLYNAASEVIVRQDEGALALIDPLRCKAAFGGDIFAYSASMVAAYPQFFPTDSFDRIKFTDVKKGVLEVDL